MTSASSVATAELGLDGIPSSCICFDFLAGSRRTPNTDFLGIDGLRPIGSAGSEVVLLSVSFFILLTEINL